jgi:hypothetical protein
MKRWCFENQQHNFLSNQQYNILFKLFLVNHAKDCKNIARGWAKPFFVRCLSTLGPFFVVQSNLSKVIDDYLPIAFEENRCC